MVNLPIVKFSVDWWTTLHQGSSVLKIGGPSMTNDYLITLLVSFLGIFMLTMYWFSNISVSYTHLTLPTILLV